MIRLMIGRDLKSIYRPPAAPPGEPHPGDRRRPRPPPTPTAAVDLDGAARRDPRARRADRRRPHRAGPRDLRHRPAARRHGAARRPRRSRSPRRATRSPPGIYLVPEDRKAQRRGPRPPDRREHLAAAAAGAGARAGWCSRGAETALAEAERRRLDIRAPGVDTAGRSRSPAATSRRSCSAKWLAMQPRAIIFDEPTRGIDVGAKREIYDMMRGARRRRRRDPDDLQRHGGGDRRQRPHRGDARGRGSAASLEREEFSEHRVLRAGRRPRAVRRERNAEEGLRAAGPDPGGRRRRRADQPALPLADQPRQHREPGRALRPLRHRPGLRHHHRRHRAVGRLGDRAARRALRRPGGQPRRALAAGGAADAGARRADRAGARAADHPARTCSRSSSRSAAC